MKLYRKFKNPKTGKIERVEPYRNKKGFYILHRLDLPSKLRKKKAYYVPISCDDELKRHLDSGRFAARCKRPGVKGCKGNEFVGPFEVEL